MLFACLLLSTSSDFQHAANPGTAIVWHWEDEFSLPKKTGLKPG